MQGISIRRSFPHLPPATVCLLSPFAAYTARRFLPAVSTASRFPHVRLAGSYLRFRFLPAFRTYCPSIPTCAFGFLPFPHVLPVNSYLRFRPLLAFRMYGSPIPTCTFGFLPLSARTTRRFLPALSTSPCLPHVHPADSYLRFRPHPVFRTYTPPIPTCTFGFLPLSARTTRRFLPALSTSPCLPHVHPVNPYLRFRPHPVFRTYTPPIPTCVSDHAASFARTPRQSLHALSASYRFPHVPPADFYLCFRFPPIFRMYGSLIPTCAFGFLPFSACTARRFLHAVSVSSHFPHVLPVNSYLRFRTFHSFRMYGSLIPTCAFGFLPFSARTARQSLPALSTASRFPHVRLADSYLRFRLPTAFRTYTPPIPTCVSDHAASFARTPRQSLPALSVSSHFPHVRLAHHMSDLHSLSEILKQKLR